MWSKYRHDKYMHNVQIIFNIMQIKIYFFLNLQISKKKFYDDIHSLVYFLLKMYKYPSNYNFIDNHIRNNAS